MSLVRLHRGDAPNFPFDERSERGLSDEPPDPRQHPVGLGIALSSRLWFPVAFRLLAFASWILLHPLEDSAVLAGGVLKHLVSLQTPLGLSRSAALTCDWGGCRLYSGAAVSMHGVKTAPCRGANRSAADSWCPSLSSMVSHPFDSST